MARPSRHRLILSLPLLLLVGCQGGPSAGRARVSGDPLFGGGASVRDLERSAGGPTGLASRGPTRPAGPLPALPTPSGSTSPAALTSGNTGALEPAPALRIGRTLPDDPRDRWNGPGEAPRPLAPPPGGDTTPAIPVPPLTQVSHHTGATLDQLMKVVDSRGAIQPQLVRAGNDWVFTCRVPSRQSPAMLYCYEATGESAAAAVAAALEQIDLDRR